MKDTYLVWLGVWLAVLPFLGIPGDWKEKLVLLTGLLIFMVGVWRLYSRRQDGVPSNEAPDTYRENVPTPENLMPPRETE